MEQLVIQKKNAISGSMDNFNNYFKQPAHNRNHIWRSQWLRFQYWNLKQFYRIGNLFYLAFINEISIVFTRLLCPAQYDGSRWQINFHCFCFFITNYNRSFIFLHDMLRKLLEVFFISKKCDHALVFDEWRRALECLLRDLSIEFHCSSLIYISMDMGGK